MTYTYGIRNPGPGLGQAPKCGGDIQVSGNGISIFLHHLIIGSPTTIQIQTIKNMHKFASTQKGLVNDNMNMDGKIDRVNDDSSHWLILCCFIYSIAIFTFCLNSLNSQYNWMHFIS